MHSRIFKLLLLTVLLLGVAAHADIVGQPPDPGNGNCFPFGCDQGGGNTFYQQVYSATAFSGPLAVQSLTFYNTQYNTGAQTLNNMSFSIYLSTTSTAVNDLENHGSYTNNYGADNMLFWTGTIGGSFPFGSELDFFGPAFNYDPTNGNLLMTIVVSSLTSGGNVYFDARNGTATDFSRYHDFGSQFDNWGLVTGFNAAVPEPASMLLVGSGLVAALRRLRK